MSGDKEKLPEKKGPSLRQRTNEYLANRANGREIPVILGMLFICLMSCIYLIYQRVHTDPEERETVGDVLEQINTLSTEPERGGSSLPSLGKVYDDIENDRQMLALIEQLQVELKREKPDVELIKALQSELKTLANGK